MIGTDLVFIPRLVTRLSDERFTAKVFTPDELARCLDYEEGYRRAHLAGVFAAKEALSKMFGVGFGRGFWWKDIELVKEESGCPQLRWVRPELHEQFPLDDDFSCSISHDGDYAIAVCHQARARTKLPTRP